MITKAYIYNKVKTAVRTLAYALLAPLFLVSCIDTIILPDDKTVDEDFWQTKEDVASMVNAAYAAMADNDLLARFIVWGDFRSDELVRSEGTKTSATTNALDEIATVNTQTTNTFASWAKLYSVVNRCNIVLERAEAVQSIDPNYTQSDYLTDRSQMLALRALCYFYLVRNFRDVPYVTEAYMNSSQNMQVAQSAPADVLARCIADLEEATKSAIAARGYSVGDWERVGWMTDDAIKSLLADIYLWRASVTHSQADYQQCIDYCDQVIDSKRSQHVRGRNEVVDQEYPLASANEMYYDLFYVQNAEESIFEIQSRSNTAVYQYYYKYENASGNGGEGWLKAATMFNSTKSTAAALTENDVFSTNDLRYPASCYGLGSDANGYDIRKLVSESPVISTAPIKNREANTDGNFNRNYNVYRLTDIMLMKAEAMVQQVDTAAEASVQAEQLRAAFNLVQAVNTRSLYVSNLADSMKWTSFSALGKDGMEKLVMQERLREFCFEGRRWYDLLRYNYRHVEGVDYTRTMVQAVDAGESLAKNYDEMLKLMARSRGGNADGVKAKMINEAYLYMPVINSDIIVCPLLRQNPAYKDTNEYEKSY